MPLDVTSAVGPAFIAALASLVTSLALLLKALPSLRRVEKQTNGRMSDMEVRNRELRDALDRATTELSHQRRTIEVLIERKGGKP